MHLDCETQSLEDQIEIAKKLPANQLAEAAHAYNWESHPVEVLGVIAERPDCTLFAALHIFCAAALEYDNAAPRTGERGIYDLLDRIHDRLNAGGYVHDPQDHSAGRPDILESLLTPLDPEEPHTGGRWQLDRSIVAPALELPEALQAAQHEQRQQWLEGQVERVLGYLNSDSPSAQKVGHSLLSFCHDDVRTEVARRQRLQQPRPSWLSRLVRRIKPG